MPDSSSRHPKRRGVPAERRDNAVSRLAERLRLLKDIVWNWLLRVEKQLGHKVKLSMLEAIHSKEGLAQFEATVLTHYSRKKEVKRKKGAATEAWQARVAEILEDPVV